MVRRRKTTSRHCAAVDEAPTTCDRGALIHCVSLRWASCMSSPTRSPNRSDGRARYDGLADWYDAQMAEGPHRDAVLRETLPRGTGESLDIGCGTGRNLIILEELGWNATGVDISEDQLRLARQRCPRVHLADAEDLPFDSGSFDLVLSAWTSTDVDDFSRVVSEAARVLRPAGRFVFYGCIRASTDRMCTASPTARSSCTRPTARHDRMNPPPGGVRTASGREWEACARFRSRSS